MPEIIQDNINGFVIPPKDFNELANHLNLLLNNAELRDRLGSAGREMVKEYFRKEIMAEKVLTIYKKFL